MAEIISARFGEVRELRLGAERDYVIARFLDANKVTISLVHHNSPGPHNLPVWEVNMRYRDRLGFFGQGGTLNEALAMIRDRKMEHLRDLAMFDVPIQRSTDDA
jgi:hypothetical protein